VRLHPNAKLLRRIAGFSCGSIEGVEAPTGLEDDMGRAVAPAMLQAIEEPSVGLPLGKLYTLGIRFFIGRAHAASLLPEVMPLIAARRLRPEEVTTGNLRSDKSRSVKSLGTCSPRGLQVPIRTGMPVGGGAPEVPLAGPLALAARSRRCTA
jgi:hypothetical protein